MRTLSLWAAVAFFSTPALAATYDVGPGQPYAAIGDVPWHQLQPGDTVRIHWQAAPYREKWVICLQGTLALPITVTGVAGPSGQLPVISGDGATTPAPLNFWNEPRGVLKIGGANTPADTTPAYIVVENLEFASGRPAYSFTGDDGGTYAYANNAAGVYIEKGRFVTIRNCVLRDCGNGLFAGGTVSDLLIEKCRIYDNGIDSSAFEHNSYTESDGITFQYNFYGPLRTNCPGNNLKDRSAGCVVRYNWIESGNRQLDLVDSATLYTDPAYGTTLVYGNVLIEPDGAGNSQIVHYGGDSGTTAEYRKGTLHFYNNTVVSTRSGNTTLFRLSSSGETCDCRNNVVYVTASGDRLGMLDSTGTLNLRNDWFKPGRVDSHSGLAGTINDFGNHVTGTAPGFVDENGQDHRLDAASACVDAGTSLAAGTQAVAEQYVKHRDSEARVADAVLDIGAYELGATGTGGTTGGSTSSGGSTGGSTTTGGTTTGGSTSGGSTGGTTGGSTGLTAGGSTGLTAGGSTGGSGGGGGCSSAAGGLGQIAWWVVMGACWILTCGRARAPVSGRGSR